MKNPDPLIKTVFEALLTLLCQVEPIIPVDKNGLLKADGDRWALTQKLLGRRQQLLSLLESFPDLVESMKIPAQNFSEAKKFTKMADFNREKVQKVHSQAANICQWIIKIVEYHDLFQSQFVERPIK